MINFLQNLIDAMGLPLFIFLSCMSITSIFYLAVYYYQEYKKRKEQWVVRKPVSFRKKSAIGMDSTMPITTHKGGIK